MTIAPLGLAAALLPLGPSHPVQDPAKLGEAYAEAIEEVNAGHAKRPGGTTEDELAGRLPRRVRSGFARLLRAKGDDAKLADALAVAAEAALELALVEDFAAATARLAELDPERAAGLGVALARPRFLLRGLGGLDGAYLERFAEVLDAVLAGYDEVFGFEEWSKVPGKKLRVRVHLVERITRPPHFAPQFPWHSEIDFPVIDAEAFRSPTPQGQFLFYGLCHELGHVIAMWGDRRNEEDHHAWAHYAGVTLVEHLAARNLACLGEARDARWRSLTRVREEVAEVAPGVGSREEVLALLVALHDAVGPRAIGDAIDHLDAEDERLRVNRVRYYSFAELRAGLLAVLEDDAARTAVEELLGD